MLKKLFSIFTCILLIGSIPISSFIVSAAIVNKGIITIGTVSGNTGDEVIVPITIDENPGIAGITVSITYESDSLEFIEDLPGHVIYEYETKAHPTRNIIRLVTSEVGNRKNNGTMISLKFKIADKAKAGLKKIDITYRQGDFCNWKLDKIMPKIIPGGVDVALSESNCPHKNYGEWTLAAVATCKESGADERICKDCGHVELRDNEPLGHEFSDKYTIDKEATETESGLMSRHCIRCKAFTDEISYTLEQSEEGKIDNTFDTEIPNNNYLEDLYKDQYPETNNSSENSTEESSDTVISDESPSSPNTEDIKYPELEIDEDTNVTIIEKIAEIFPKIEDFIKIFKIALIILIVVSIL